MNLPVIVAVWSTFILPSTLNPALNEASPVTPNVLFKVVAPSTFNAWLNEASF